MAAGSESTRKSRRDVAKSSGLGERRHFGGDEEDVHVSALYHWLLSMGGPARRSRNISVLEDHRHAEERDYLLRERGDTAAARERARAFLAKYPDSLLRMRVEPLAR